MNRRELQNRPNVLPLLSRGSLGIGCAERLMSMLDRQMSRVSVSEEELESVLVAGPPFRGYVEMVASGFENCGVLAHTLPWKTNDYSLANGVRSMLSVRHREKSVLQQECENANSLEHAILSFSPDYIVVLKGARISEKARRFCCDNGIKTALWAYDSAFHVPMIKEVAGDYDLLYLYEPADIALFQDREAAEFLPMAYDPELYFPASGDSIPGPDLSFVGSLSDTPKRIEAIKALAGDSRLRTIEVWTDTVHWYSPTRVQDALRFRRYRNLRLKRSTSSHTDISGLYNRSKICLNVHHAQSTLGVNPRTFEIMGSGGFLLTDHRLEGIQGFAEGRDYVTYSSLDELVEIANLYVEDEEERLKISKSGHRIAAENHTYYSRACSILKDLRRWTK